ncbi:MAG: hypothetical protein R3E18_01260 [Sphingomonadaceae bacterium]
MAGIGGAATAAQLAIANPPVGFPTSLDWLWAAPNPWLTITALCSGLGAVSAILTFFQPKPYSEEQAEKDRQHANASFAALDGRNDERKDELLQAIERDKHEQAISDLIAGKVAGELLARYHKALGIKRESGQKVSPREAAEFALAADRAAQSDDPRIRKIARLIDDGQIIAASDRKAEIAEEAVQCAASELRDAAYLALPVSPSRAMEHFKRATELDPSDLWSWVQLGRLRAIYDTLASAELCLRNGLQQVKSDHDRMVLHGEFGNLMLVKGDLTAAKSEYESAFAIIKNLAAMEPGNSQWQRDLSVSHEELGNLEIAAGNLAAARTRFESGLAIREKLADMESGNSQWQRDLSVSHVKLGDLEMAAGNLAAARTRFESSLAIAEKLAAMEPGNSQWQRDLSVSHEMLGDLEIAAGNLTAARTRFESDLAIAEKLAAMEPGNSEWRRDLSVSHNKLGDLEMTAGNLAAARTHFESGLAIREKLAAVEPGNSQWQRDLFFSNYELGQLALAEGKADLARSHFLKAKEVMAALVEEWPDHPGFARDLATVNSDLAGLGAAGEED